MPLLHRSGKRLLLNKAFNIRFADLAEFPLRAFHHLCQLEGEPAQKNIINRHFSAFLEDQIHQPSLRSQHQGYLLINVYPDVSLSKHMHMYVYQERKCKGERLEHDALELASGATLSKSVAHVDDCAFTDVDDCALASQKTFTKPSDLVVDEVGTVSQEKHKEKRTNEGVLEIVVAEAQTVYLRDNKKGKQIDSDTSELAEADFLTEEEKNKRFDVSTLELAVLDPREASSKDMKKKRHLVSSMPEGACLADGTTKYLSKAEQGQIVHDSTSESFASDAKVECMEKQGSKAAVNNTNVGLQREDKGMLMVKDTFELCLNDIRPSSDKMREEGKCSDLTGFLQGDGASEKAKLSTTKHVRVSLPSERKYFVVQKKKKKKKKRKSWNINSQLGPEDLKQLSLPMHPICTAEAGLASCDEKPETCGRSSKYIHARLPNYNMVLSRIVSPVILEESSGCADSNAGSIDAMSGDVLKLEDKEKKRESIEAAFADGRQVNQGMTNEFVEEKQKMFACEDSSKSRLDQNKPGTVRKHNKSIEQYEEGKEDFIKNTSWEEEVIKRQHREQMTGKIWRQWEEGPAGWKEEAHRPLLLTEKPAHSNALSKNHIATNEVIDKISTSPTHSLERWQRSHTEMESHMRKESHTIDTVEREKEAANEAASCFLQNRGKNDHFKAGTSLDSSSNVWMTTHLETTEKEMDGNQWDHAGAPKVHYPLRNCRELYIILDLNGVLIKRWGNNPSLPGVCKLNKKWIQLRPGCIEFLQKAFSSFRVGIWSTMTQKNVRGVCKFLEQQAHQSLPFFMLWSKDSCYQHRGIQRPDKSHVIADFKPLSHVWGFFRPLGFHNTVLVDDSPYKACMNNQYNCLFPDAFEGCTDDKYLNDVLWPYLERMRMSKNIQAYIANNPLGQQPVVVGHELYYHVRQVIDVFDYLSKPVTRAR